MMRRAKRMADSGVVNFSYALSISPRACELLRNAWLAFIPIISATACHQRYYLETDSRYIVAEVVKAVVGAVVSARKDLAATQPRLPKGRPSTPAAKAAARTKKQLAAQGAALFTHRYLFVQRHLNKTERKTLWRVSRGLPQLHALRAVMEQVYALFDRRCRTQTALNKLAKLRCRLRRFRPLGEILKKLFSPTLEKALTFLDSIGIPILRSPSRPRDTRARWGEEGTCCEPMMGWM